MAGVKLRRIFKGGLRGPSYSDAEARRGFLYHATDGDATTIMRRGLKVHRPWHGTDQRRWPDMSKDKRAYFAPKLSTTAAFGSKAVFRVRAKLIGAKPERGTGDWYTTKRVPGRLLQVLGADGKWHRAQRTRTLKQRQASRANLRKARAAASRRKR